MVERKLPVGRTTLRALRVVALSLVVLVFVQVLLAAGFVDGGVRLLSMHAINAYLITAATVVCVLLSALLRWRCRGALWPFIASLVLMIGFLMQAGFGYERAVAVHIALGVTLVAMTCVVTYAFWRHAHQPRLSKSVGTSQRMSRR